jgi:diguanylate cyclase (GGDEF)-like protein/PAS domain S-box-containing protein
VENHGAPIITTPLAIDSGGRRTLSIGLWLTLFLLSLSYIHFLWFHTLAELFSIAVGVSLYLIAHNSYHFTRNNFLLFLAQGFFWVAVIDMVHTLSYKGMGLIPGGDPNPATQLWLCARALEAGVLLLAPLFLGKQRLPKWSFGLLGVLAVGAIALVFLGVFPDAFVVGHGLTPLKIASEYVIIVLLLLAGWHLYRHHEALDPELFRTILGVIALTMISEFAFTLYIDVYGLSNLVGHIAKLWAFSLLLTAVSRWMLAHPFRLLARDAGSFESMPMPVLLLNSDGIIQSCNQSARQRFRDGGVGQSLHSIWHPGNRPVAECPVCQTIQRGDAIQSELYDPMEDEWSAISLQPVRQDHILHGFICVHEDITDRKRAEAAQRASDARLGAILENAPDAVFVVNPEGRFTYVNRSAEELVGYCAKDLLQMGISDLTPPEELATTLDSYHKTLSAGRDRLETNLIHRDGRWIPVEVNGVRLPDGNVYGAVRDLSERMLTARKLMQQGALLRRIIDSIPDLIFFKDPKGVYIGCNRSFEKYFGHKESEIIGKTDFDFVDNITAAAFREHDRAMLALERPRINEEYVTYPDGRRALLETLKTPYFDDQQQLLGLIGISRDITERRRTEELARANEKRYRALFDHMLEAYAYSRILYEDGKPTDFILLEVNPKFSELTGLGDVTDKRISQLIPGVHDNNPELLERYARVAGGGEPERFETFMPGLARWFLVSVYSFEPEHFVAVFDNITERKEYEAQLEHQANHDPLTGLANRNLLVDRLTQSLVFAHRSDRQVAAMLLDLDRFKLINDGLGHGSGDILLRSIAERLSECVRPGDTVARLGGDEFMIIMSDVATENDAITMAHRLLQSVAYPVTIETREVVTTASIGVALYPRDGENAMALIKNADVAMYRAKDRGRNRFQFYSPEMNARTVERLELETGLRRALDLGELVLHYQPQVELQQGRVIGAEALIRWHHPERGLVPPNAFIPLAEEIGLIVPIGEWVLDTACAQLKKWQRQGLEDIRLSINVSARQFQHRGLTSLIKKALLRHSIQPARLEIEVTESSVMQDPELTITVLRELKEIGVRIALDDFGTGYSSLNYLKLFPTDNLKIDQSFVHDLISDQSDAAIALSVITLAHSLKRMVLAEGVETPEQLAFLQQHGCDLIQGHLFSPAVPAEEFIDLVTSGKTLALSPPRKRKSSIKKKR